WRDPIYRTPRELAMSYAHEYCLPSGRKSLLEFSRPFSLARYAPGRWLIAQQELDWLMEALDDSPHLPLAPAGAMRNRRRAAQIEIDAQKIVEWPDPRKGRKRTRLPPRTHSL